MTQFTDAVDSLKAEVSKKQSALKAAERAKNNAIKKTEREIKQLKSNASKKLSSFEGITLYADRITYKGTTYALSGKSSARVETSGSIYTESSSKNSVGVSIPGAIVGGAIAGPVGAVVGGKKNKVEVTTDIHDDRSIYLEVQGDDGSFSVKGNPDKEDKMRSFAADINSAAAKADSLKETTSNQIETLEKELAQAKADNDAINQCHIELTNAEKELADFKASASEDELKELEEHEKEQGKKAIKTLLIIIGVALFLLLFFMATCSQGGKENIDETNTSASTASVSSETTVSTAQSEDNEGSSSSDQAGDDSAVQDLMNLAIGDTASLKDCNATITSISSEDGVLSIEYNIEAKNNYSFNPEYIVASNDDNRTETPKNSDGMQSLKKGDVFKGKQSYDDDGSLTKLKWISFSDNDAEWHFTVERTKSPVMDVLDNIENTPAADIHGVLTENGFNIKYKHAVTGMDFTEDVAFSVANPDDESSLPWLVIGYERLDREDKEVTLLIDTQENMDRISQEQSTAAALTEKLDPMTAWIATAEYGDREYPYGFKLHYIMDKYAETAEDENTWFLKAGCTVTNEFNAQGSFTCEARVTGTEENPEVIYFIVY